MRGELLNRRRVMTEQDSILPRDYRRVKSIVTTGEQYVNLGFSVSTSARTSDFVVTIKGTIHSLQGSPYIFGGADGGSYAQYAFLAYLTRWTFCQAGRLYFSRPITNEKCTIITSVLDGCKVYNEDGDLIDTSGTGLSSWFLSINRPVYLFAANKSPVSNFIQMELEYAKFTYLNHNNGVESVIRDLYPCVRKIDGEVGLFDLQNGVFYGNNGTGNFIVG